MIHFHWDILCMHLLRIPFIFLKWTYMFRKKYKGRKGEDTEENGEKSSFSLKQRCCPCISQQMQYLSLSHLRPFIIPRSSSSMIYKKKISQSFYFMTFGGKGSCMRPVPLSLFLLPCHTFYNSPIWSYSNLIVIDLMLKLLFGVVNFTIALI